MDSTTLGAQDDRPFRRRLDAQLRAAVEAGEMRPGMQRTN